MSETVSATILEAAAAGRERLVAAIAAAGGAPLQDGRTTTFLYYGQAEAVGLHHWMDVFAPLPEFARHGDTNLWSLTIHLPDESRVEYKLSVKARGRRRLVLDRLNPRRARDPFGTNSVVTGPGYERPSWSLPSQAPHGTIEHFSIASDAFGETRRVGLYLPAGAPQGAFPLLIAHDGTEYVEYAALATVLDNLIAAGELPPLAAALSDPIDRTDEYRATARHADHLVEELIPAVAERIDLADSRVAMGASLGGVASLHAAHRHPDAFTGLILQSGSFVTALGGRHRRGPVFAPVVEFMAEFAAHATPLPSRIHVSCGRFDGLIAENRAIERELRARGADVVYEEVPDGHNWENWRDRLRAGLLHSLSGSVERTKEGTE